MRRSPVALNLAIGVLVLVATLALLLRFMSHTSTEGTSPSRPPEPVQASYSTLVNAVSSGQVQTLTVDQRTGKATATYKSGALAEVMLPTDDAGLLRQVAEKGGEVTVKRSDPNGGGSSLLATILTPLVFFALMFFVLWLVQRRSRKAGGMLGGGLPDMSLRRSTAVTVVPPQRFSDVAGCDEAVEELAELVQFFTDPASFSHVGARMPSGVMLYGEPGTGKTLLARALAGEAGIPFYAASGSDFVEKFVGVGAARMRELFAKARSHPEGAVVFIDEIDAIGRARSAVDGNSEREQTLNQILVELDGFSTTDRAVCIAATNRLDVLDPALLRPGRFGRHIAVSLPSAAGRTAILTIHAAGKPIGPDVDLAELAHTMGGLSGAQLAEVVNEAAIMAGRERSLTVDSSHFREAYLRVLAGPKRRSAPIAEGELEVIACHEAGHVLCAEHGERYEKAQQVTVEPRGQAMGLAVYGQTDRALHDPQYLHEALVATLGGRAAEQIVFKRVSSGAANDLQKATELARRAVEELGFSPRLGQVVAGSAPFSEATRAVVDSEIERMVAEAYSRALELLTEHRHELDLLRERLFEQRVLDRVDILAAIGNVVRLPRRSAAPAAEQPSEIADSKLALRPYVGER